MPAPRRRLCDRGVLVRKYGSVLGDNVKQMDPAQLNHLGDVGVSYSNRHPTIKLRLGQIV